ncbi:MAG: RtcB family protein [Actinobacteria bacterium]|nr:RtcB family protein [Actinomycetota bacterium]
MQVNGVIFADSELLEQAIKDKAIEQVANVAFLPGIVKASIAMPDIHWGYGFPIGGVAATDPEQGGVISPGGVGFDISCGVRVMRTDLYLREVERHIDRLVDALAVNIPKGVGSTGKIKTKRKELEEICVKGARWAVEKGFGWKEDLDYIEERGTFPNADPSKVSSKAFERGSDQPGTLGAGNHFLEVQVVEKVFDEKVAEVFGLFEGQLVIMVHSGSRGFGHQICTDYLRVMDAAVRKYGFKLPDRQLACAPVESKEGKDYFAAMACAVNYALCNREILGHWVRFSLEQALKMPAERMGVSLIFDVSHNIAKFEKHNVDGKIKVLCVHRKGATRAFGPGREDLPEKYRKVGQPVIIPGDMGSASYILVGTKEGEEKAFASTCHGAGRVMSRAEAKRKIRGSELKSSLEARGIRVVSGSMSLLAEEAPEAYKDVNRVVDVCEKAGLSKKVAKLRPLAVVKG